MKFLTFTSHYLDLYQHALTNWQHWVSAESKATSDASPAKETVSGHNPQVIAHFGQDAAFAEFYRQA